jgi:hypothetical protein
LLRGQGLALAHKPSAGAQWAKAQGGLKAHSPIAEPFTDGGKIRRS